MNETTHDGREFSFTYSLRTNFYALAPSETYYEHVSEVPDMVATAVPVMMLMAVVEALVLKLTGRDDKWRLHIAVLNYSAGGLTQAFNNFILRGLELTVYIWVYKNWSITFLPWDSFYTYLVAMTGVEFCYYWWHRMAHETGLMWAAHSIHHSSEDFNMTIAARNTWTMRPFMWWFFVPLAVIGLPPSIFLIHNQLSFVWAAWTHNETVPKLSKVIPYLGHAIEYIFITPSHHRVHHGANKYCIDKNYGQTFIIFDRVFGTFAEERDDEELVYGTLGQKDNNSAMFVHIAPWMDLWQKVQSMDNFGDKVRTLVYGPGWTPGKPRLGDPNDIPDVRGRQKIQLVLPVWFSTYMLVNSALVFFSYIEMMGRIMALQGTWIPLINLAYMCLAYTALGGLYDGRRYGALLEPLRLALFLLLSQHLPMFGTAATTTVVSWVYMGSLLLSPATVALTLKRATKTKTQ